MALEHVTFSTLCLHGDPEAQAGLYPKPYIAAKLYFNTDIPTLYDIIRSYDSSFGAADARGSVCRLLRLKEAPPEPKEVS